MDGFPYVSIFWPLILNSAQVAPNGTRKNLRMMLPAYIGGNRALVRTGMCFLGVGAEAAAATVIGYCFTLKGTWLKWNTVPLSHFFPWGGSGTRTLLTQVWQVGGGAGREVFRFCVEWCGL